MEDLIYQAIDSVFPSRNEDIRGLILIAGVLFVIATILLFVWAFLLAMKRLMLGALKFLSQRKERKRYPRMSKEDDLERLSRRQQFAEHVESEIRRLNTLETWSHYRFTELEAEVEAEGEYRTNQLFFPHRSNARIESSLSVALEKSEERRILVEGDPGSGKSVALRQVALIMAKKAATSEDSQMVIPIYINLKELKEKNSRRRITDESEPTIT